VCKIRVRLLLQLMFISFPVFRIWQRPT
jgi:hypothetical protein